MGLLRGLVFTLSMIAWLPGFIFNTPTDCIEEKDYRVSQESIHEEELLPILYDPYIGNTREAVKTETGSLLLENRDMQFDIGLETFDLVRQFDVFEYYTETYTEHEYRAGKFWRYLLPHIPEEYHFITADGTEYDYEDIIETMLSDRRPDFTPENRCYLDECFGYELTSPQDKIRRFIIDIEKEGISLEVSISTGRFLWMRFNNYEKTVATYSDGLQYTFDAGSKKQLVSSISHEDSDERLDFHYRNGAIDTITTSQGQIMSYSFSKNGMQRDETIKFTDQGEESLIVSHQSIVGSKELTMSIENSTEKYPAVQVSINEDWYTEDLNNDDIKGMKDVTVSYGDTISKESHFRLTYNDHAWAFRSEDNTIHDLEQDTSLKYRRLGKFLLESRKITGEGETQPRVEYYSYFNKFEVDLYSYAIDSSRPQTETPEDARDNTIKPEEEYTVYDFEIEMIKL